VPSRGKKKKKRTQIIEKRTGDPGKKKGYSKEDPKRGEKGRNIPQGKLQKRTGPAPSTTRDPIRKALRENPQEDVS